MTSGLIKKLSSNEFEETISQGVTLVDFYAEWCGPCRMLVPILEEIAEEMQDKVKFCKLDLDQAQEITSRFEVTSVPTLILFKDGKEIDRLIGLKDAAALKEFITESL